MTTRRQKPICGLYEKTNGNLFPGIIHEQNPRTVTRDLGPLCFTRVMSINLPRVLKMDVIFIETTGYNKTVDVLYGRTRVDRADTCDHAMVLRFYFKRVS